MLNVDTESKNIFVTFRHNDSVEKYICSISACKNPVCTCGIINLDLRPSDAVVDGDGDNIAAIRVEIDIYKKSLAYRDKKKIPKEQLQFAKLFVKKLDDSDFKILYKEYFALKNTNTESADPASIDAYFEFDEIEDNGSMPAYNDILPYGDQMGVKINDTLYMIFDQHCILPKCTCTDSVLNFLELEVAGKTTGKELCTVWVNYKKKEWFDLDGSSLPFSIEKLKSVVEEQAPDIYKRLRKRKNRLKAIYANCKKRHFASSHPPRLPKVGRNDLCPCGSGKKYKKCCLQGAG